MGEAAGSLSRRSTFASAGSRNRGDRSVGKYLVASRWWGYISYLYAQVCVCVCARNGSSGEERARVLQCLNKIGLEIPVR